MREEFIMLIKSSNFYLGVMIFLAILMFVCLWTFTCDDAFIVMRYAENLVRHGELTFNRGEYISALTSPLHAIVEAGLFSLFGHTEFAFKVFSSLLFSIVGFFLIRSLRREKMPIELAGIVITSPFLVLWAIGGLETLILTSLLFFASALFISTRTNSSISKLAGISLACGLAFLTRYDSILFTAPLILSLFATNTSFSRRSLIIIASLFIPILWLSFAQTYYGEILPTSFFVKTPGESLQSIVRGVITGIDFLLFSGACFLGLAVFIVARQFLKSIILENFRTPLILGFTLYFLIYGSLSGAHHMMFSYRLFVPALPILVLLTADICRDFQGRRPAEGSNLNDALRNLSLAVVVLNFTNFVVILFGTIHPARLGEYQNLNVREYNEQFMNFIPEAAKAIQSDWSQRNLNRPPRIYTFVGGLLPYKIPEAYIVEQLVSYRHNCRPKDPAKMLDYVHLFKSINDFDRVVQELEADHFELLWKQDSNFPGCYECGVRWMVFKRKNSAPPPDPIAYPSKTKGPCLYPVAQ